MDELTRRALDRAVLPVGRAVRGRDPRLSSDLGFSNVRSLKGGINAWAEQVDPTLTTY